MKVAIINLGSQYTHVIWRTIRDLGVEAVIHQKNTDAKTIDFFDAYVLSGGPGSVGKDRYPAAERAIRETGSGKSNKPILGVCLGHQLIAHMLGGKIGKGPSAEYGVSQIIVDEEGALFLDIPKKFKAWVSHFDEVKQMPQGFISLAHSDTCKVEAMQSKSLPIFSTQFHPEVWHTEHGEKILENFLKACGRE